MKKRYSDFKVAYDEMQERSPSILRYTPMLWVLKWLLRLLFICSVVFFLSTFIQPIWERMHSAITHVDYLEEQSMRILLHTARIALFIIILVTWLALKFAQIGIRRNWFIVDLSSFTEELLSHLKEKDQ